MDGISVVASIAQIAELTLASLNNLNRYYQRSFRNAATRSKELRDRVTSLLDILSEAQESLELPERSGPAPREFEKIKEWLSQLENRTRPQLTRGIWLWMWPFGEQEIDKIIKEIDSLKGDLNTRNRNRNRCNLLFSILTYILMIQERH